MVHVSMNKYTRMVVLVMLIFFFLVSRFTILTAAIWTDRESLRELVSSESRIMLLYCTRDEASHILSAASDLHITGENYVWVVTQSVIGNLVPPQQFPIGMLGESHFSKFYFILFVIMEFSLSPLLLT